MQRWRSVVARTATTVGVGLALLWAPANRVAGDEVEVVKLGTATGYRLLDVKWQDGPFPGSKVSLLAGDPNTGISHMYLKLPDGCRIPPHWHSADEYVTVVEGTVLVGQGETFQEDKMRLFGPGAFVHIPAKSPHFARAKGQVVLSQTRTGAADFHWVNPADDPTKAAQKPAVTPAAEKK
jgi:quercetin dioxygenase-like cupin family protein